MSSGRQAQVLESGTNVLLALSPGPIQRCKPARSFGMSSRTSYPVPRNLENVLLVENRDFVHKNTLFFSPSCGCVHRPISTGLVAREPLLSRYAAVWIANGGFLVVPGPQGSWLPRYRATKCEKFGLAWLFEHRFRPLAACSGGSGGEGVGRGTRCNAPHHQKPPETVGFRAMGSRSGRSKPDLPTRKLGTKS